MTTRTLGVERVRGLAWIGLADQRKQGKNARMSNKASNAKSSLQLHPEGQGQGEIERTRRSFYLSTEVIDAVELSYRELNHQLYPAEVIKSVFLEALIRYGLDNLEEVKTILIESASRSHVTQVNTQNG
jgi:hypothetical protein